MNAFEQIIAQFNNAVPQWEAVGIDLAKQLFLILVVIQIVWMAVLWMVNRNDPTNLFAEFVGKLLVILFFWALLENYNVWIPAIVNSLRQVGERMTGIGSLSPADVMSRGVDIATRVMTAAKHEGFIQHIFGSIIASIVGCTIFFLFVRIGIEMFLIIIGGKIILAGGLILLGFSGTKWSRQFTERYLTAAVAIGIKMLFITLIVGIGETLAPGWSDILKNVQGDKLMEAYFAVFAAALVYFYLALRLPEMAASLLTGAFNLNFSPGLGTAVMGSAIGGAYALSIGSSAAGNFVKGAMGAGSAVIQAIKAGSAAAEISGATGINKTAQTAVSSLQKLAGASGQHIKESIDTAISRTTGGQIANQIKTIAAAEKNDKEKSDEPKT
jgi:type IV secretion system protein TrbL